MRYLILLLLTGCGAGTVDLECYDNETGELILKTSGWGPFPAAQELTPKHTKITMRGEHKDKILVNATCTSRW